MKDFHLSDTERKIISILRHDSRTSYKTIAKDVGVAISTVHNTIKRLVNEGVIKKFSIKLESKAIGYDVTTIIGIKVRHGALKEVEEQLVNHLNVCQVFVVTGEYDLMVIAKFQDTKALNKFVRNFLQNSIGAERTNTSLVLSTEKERLNPQF